MRPVAPMPESTDDGTSLPVSLDGKMLGYINSRIAGPAIAHLRAVKAARLAQEDNLTPGGLSQPATQSLDGVMVDWRAG